MEDFVYNCYIIENYKKIYVSIIMLIFSEDMWFNYGFLLLDFLVVKRLLGRLKKKKEKGV